jgi:hypothetical protein
VGLALCVALHGCARCDPPEGKAIATLTDLVGGGITRDFAARLQQWQKAEEGAALALGDGAQTDAHSTAELRFANGSGLALKPGTIVRLLPDEADRQTSFDIQAGEAILRVGSRGIKLRTHVGLAEIEPESELLLRREGDTLSYAVALGRVAFKDHERREVLNAGDSMSVGIGMAVLQLQRKQGQGEDDSGQIVVEVIRGEARTGEGKLLAQGSHTVAPNTRLRLPEGTELFVKRGQERVRLKGAGEFTVGVADAIAESERGAMQVEALDVDVEVRVPGGVIIARGGQGGSSADVNVGAGGGSLRVLKGNVRAQLPGRDAGDGEELSAGQEASWQLDGARDAAVAPGPSYQNMSAASGESFVVHAPSVPVAISFGFASKCAEGQLELVNGHQLQRGKGSARLLFPAGTRAYTLRCVQGNGLGKVVARGTVQVLVDPGTRNLPPRAPTSTIDADGRTYSIYYQNQPPEVIARWPNAPAQASYQLELDGKKMELGQPEHLFKSGALRDGSHTLAFLAEGRRSRTTTVEVHFDNVAPKAALSSPDDRAFAAGDAITVEGVALPTWKVSLEGGTIEMSGGDRFSGQIQTSAEHPDVAVRLSHPRLGTHYYLRRASGSP